MVRIRSGVAVSGFLAVAIGTVGVLTAQAAGAPLRARAGGEQGPASAALPARSGHGQRVVYSPGGRRVWLVDAHDRVLRTFQVAPGAVRPAVGTHRVFAREPAGGGLRYVVLFASADGSNIGFGVPADGSTATAPAVIREEAADGSALWGQAAAGSLVRVTS
jgi:hypothetical protein